MLIAIVWGVGVLLATPGSMGDGSATWNARQTLRLIARFTQMLWAPGAALGPLSTTLAASPSGQESLVLVGLAMSMVALLGWIAFGMLLHLIAEDIDLDDAPRRIGVALWTVPMLTVGLMFLPQHMFFLLLALILPFLLAWGWYLAGFARGVWEMRQYMAWDLRSGAESIDRESRIAHARAELEREANAIIRPLPPGPHAPPTKPGPIPRRR